MSRLSERALPIPDGVVDAEGVENTELVRIWWQENGPRMIIRPALREPQMVGAMLAELSYHFSKAFEERTAQSQAEALKAIQKGWSDAHALAASQKEGAR